MYSRADLQRYADGLKALRNATVLRTGGVRSRPGTQYLGTTKGNGVARLIEAVFDTDAAYVLEFGNLYVRFWKEGALVAATVTGAWANTTAYTAGVVVSYSGTNYVCLVAHTSVEATDRPSTGSSWQTKWYALTGTTYELPTPYTTAQLFEMQVRTSDYNTAYIAHPSHPFATLVRTSNNVWDLSDVDFEGEADVPGAVAVSGGAGTEWGYTVTAVDADGVESGAGAFVRTDIAGNVLAVQTTLSGANRTVTWGAVAGAASYKVYGQEAGTALYAWILTPGGVTGTTFVDDGSWALIPAFPPVGAGDFDGAGKYPGVVGAYQQRLLLSGSTTKPDVVFASRTADPANFTESTPIVDSDSLSWRQVGSRLHRVRHLIEAARTLWSFSDVGETIVQGAEDSILVPGSPNPRQYSANGAAQNPDPLIANDSVLYVQARGGIVRDLFPVQLGGFAGSDLTLQSAHLVDGYTIADWTYQQTPDSVIWAVRSDGELLSLTYVRELGILGWARHDTDGLFKSIATVPESNRDAVYAVVERTINSSTVRYVERFYDRLADDPILMDSAETIVGANYATLTLSGYALGGPPPFEAFTATGAGHTAAWTAADVGRFITLTDGVVTEEWEITGRSGNAATITRDTGSTAFSNSDVFAANTGWYYSSLADFGHLHGESVSIVADGAVVASPNNPAYDTVTVTGGVVTPGVVFASLTVGLPYVTDIQTLDLDMPQSTTKPGKFLITSVGAWVEETLSFYAGPEEPTGDTLALPSGGAMQPFQVLDRNENAVTTPQTGYRMLNFEGRWGQSGSVFIRNVDPTPLTVLALVPYGTYPR